MSRDVVAMLIGSKAGGKAALNGAVLAIVKNPSDATVAVGEYAYFTVEAASKSTKAYQWQYSADGGETWSNSGATGNKSATLRITGNASFDGYPYRCVISSGGAQAICKPATLHISE